MFDANALTATPFRSAWWKILALASDEWDVKVLIPKVSFEEMVGHAERAEDKLINELRLIARKVGNTPVFQQAVAELQKRRDAVRPYLIEGAEIVGVEFVDPVTVPPLEIVQRQIRRAKPCKETSGDGYRDTLNWLTVLDVATKNPGKEVAWVSTDKDFAATERAFHQELLSEAEAAGVVDRLSLWPSLGDLIRGLLEKNELGQDAEAAHLALTVHAVQRYAAKRAPQLLIDDGHFSDNDILVIPKPFDVDVEQRSEDNHHWPFTVQVYAIAETEGVAAAGYAAVTGTVTTDSFGKPIDGQIAEVDWIPEPDKETALEDQHGASARFAIGSASIIFQVLLDEAFTRLFRLKK